MSVNMHTNKLQSCIFFKYMYASRLIRTDWCVHSIASISSGINSWNDLCAARATQTTNEKLNKSNWEEIWHWFTQMEVWRSTYRQFYMQYLPEHSGMISFGPLVFVFQFLCLFIPSDHNNWRRFSPYLSSMLLEKTFLKWTRVSQVTLLLCNHLLQVDPLGYPKETNSIAFHREGNCSRCPRVHEINFSEILIVLLTDWLSYWNQFTETTKAQVEKSKTAYLVVDFIYLH